MSADNWCVLWYFMGLVTGYLIWRIVVVRRDWVGLTDEEVNEIYIKNLTTANNFVRAAEAKLKEKNT